MSFEPSKKSEQVEDFIGTMFGFDRREQIRQSKCVPAPVGCGKLLTETDFAKSGEVEYPFRDAVSAKEYTISGFCQDCQDRVFGEVEEEEEEEDEYEASYDSYSVERLDDTVWDR